MLHEYHYPLMSAGIQASLFTHSRFYSMIPKKDGSIKVEKLRTIVLMEPDFNFINKVIGKRVMKMAENANSIAPEQFGSRKAKSSILHAVNKQLTTDLLRQDKKDFCMIILDAKACYDRITPMYASLAMQRQGATPQMIDLMFETIASMKHYVRTSFGQSNIYYQQKDQLFHGILQGNGAGPTMWTLISSTILDRLRSKGLGVSISTQVGETIKIPAFAFVDDTDLLQEIQSEEDIHLPQSIVTEWSTGVQTTGGMLVGDKCSFQVIRHIWRNNQWIINDSTSKNIQITVPENNKSSNRTNHITAKWH
jgi:Reverse transcriptase (RNA-dependent DNA polymerase)